ncbi:MAG: error-prone DNA polymerase [Rhizobiaceae bacterium]
MNTHSRFDSSQPAYAEFAIQSNFSFLQGASSPEELVASAKALGLSAIGLADRNTVAGVVRAWKRAEAAKLSYHPGCRLVFSDGTPDILAYPRDRGGWGNLCRMLTVANMRGEKGEPDLHLRDFWRWGDRMSLAVLLDMNAVPPLDWLRRLKRRFPRAIRLAVAIDYSGNDHFRLCQAANIAQAIGVPLMAVNNVLCHNPDRRPLQDVLTAIRLKKTVADSGFELSQNAERHLKPPLEMARLFRRHPEALVETFRFAGELHFSLSELKHNYPEETTEAGVDPQTELERLTWEGAKERYAKGIPDSVRALIEHELQIVAEKKYARYFLTVRDIVRFAREAANVLCQGRGSAANSLICYCLGITAVGPELSQPLFERFISTERDEPPDIDVDFEHEQRDKIIAYIYEKYSSKRTALAAAVISYRGRSAMREVAKAMGLSDDIQSAMSGSIWGWSTAALGEREAAAAGLDRADPKTAQVFALANEIIGFPRHLSQHVGGFVITKDRLDEIVPIVKTAMDERKMVEWDKDDLDAVGLLKVDVLALGMLSCLRRAFELLASAYARHLTLESIPKEDPTVYDMICRADTLGVFQIESRAQMSMLPRLRPRKFYDLVIEVAIVRPGPIQGDMVHPYLRRRQGKEPVDYPSQQIRAILERTLGVPLFQEQAMKIAIDAGGFSPGEADQLRRAMATFKRNGTIGNYRHKMIEGMVSRGYPREFAERCFKQIEGFGEYGFPESHAASFALLVYASCWFKAYYPDVFCAAILNSQPMGFYAPAQLIRDAREHSVEVREVDINHSDWDCLLEPATFDPAQIAPRHAEMRTVIKTEHAVRLGFRSIKGLPEKKMEVFVECRGKGYVSVRDVWLRSGLDVDEIEKLAQADAFRSIGLDRRAALWAVKALDGRSAVEMLPLFDQPNQTLRDLEPQVCLPAMPLSEHVIQDYRSLSLSLKAHPVSFLRHKLDSAGVTPNGRLPSVPDGKRVTVAGLVLVRQRPGKGNAIFLTLEDEQGIANVIIWARKFERFRPIVMGSKFIRVSGKLQCESDVIHIVAERMADLTPWLADLSEAATFIDPYGPTDEVKRGIDEDRRTTKSKTFAVATKAAGRLIVPSDRVENLARDTAQVMPKGRNFQ